MTSIKRAASLPLPPPPAPRVSGPGPVTTPAARSTVDSFGPSINGLVKGRSDPKGGDVCEPTGGRDGSGPDDDFSEESPAEQKAKALGEALRTRTEPSRSPPGDYSSGIIGRYQTGNDEEPQGAGPIIDPPWKNIHM